MRNMTNLVQPSLLENSAETQLLIEDYFQRLNRSIDRSLTTKIPSIYLCKIIGVVNSLLTSGIYQMARNKTLYACSTRYWTNHLNEIS